MVREDIEPAQFGWLPRAHDWYSAWGYWECGRES